VFANSSSTTGSITIKHFSEGRGLQLAVKVVHVFDVSDKQGNEDELGTLEVLEEEYLLYFLSR
jgi:hypothetical protein